LDCGRPRKRPSRLQGRDHEEDSVTEIGIPDPLEPEIEIVPGVDPVPGPVEVPEPVPAPAREPDRVPA
jgi:hypothetical protein